MGKHHCVAQDKTPIVNRLPEACRDEVAAVEFIEEMRWGGVAVCVHCSSCEVYQMRDAKTGGRSARFLWRCHECKRQFTYRSGTVMADSLIPARMWCLALWLACASKKGVSALQVKRLTGLSYKSALFLMHRIRKAMASTMPPGSLRGVIEADETFIGGVRKVKHRYRSPFEGKEAVFGMVERGGKIKPIHMGKISGKDLKEALRHYVDKSAMVMTDEAAYYQRIGREFDGGHATVNHKWGEYARGPVSTNTIEGFFGLLKRGVNGTFHHISAKHLHRYLSEFEFRYNNRDVDDGERTARLIRAAEGKRLTYKQQVGP